MKTQIARYLIIAFLAVSFPLRVSAGEDDSESEADDTGTLETVDCVKTIVTPAAAKRLLKYMRITAQNEKRALQVAMDRELEEYARRHKINPSALRRALVAIATELIAMEPKPKKKTITRAKSVVNQDGVPTKFLLALEDASKKQKTGTGAVAFSAPRDWLERLAATPAFTYFQDHLLVEDSSKLAPKGESFVEDGVVPPALVRAIFLILLRPLEAKYSRAHQLKIFADDKTVDEKNDLIYVRLRWPFESGSFFNRFATKVGVPKDALARAILRYGLEVLEGTLESDLF